MKPKWQKLASLAQEICTLYFQFFDAFFASKGYPFKNIFDIFKEIKLYKSDFYFLSQCKGGHLLLSSMCKYKQICVEHSQQLSAL